MKQFILLFFLGILTIHLSAQTDWSLSGNDGTAASKLGTTNSSPLSIYTSNLKRLTITEDGKIGYGTVTPNYQFQLHSTSPGLAFADDKGEEVYGSTGTQSVLQITNEESGAGPGDGLLIGMTGGTAFMRTTDKLRMNIQNNDSYMSLNAEGRIDFFGSSGTTDAKLNLYALADKGFQIIRNSGSSGYGMRIKAGQSNLNAFEIYKSNSVQMVIKGDGRIGLGTDSPSSSYLLDAAGKIRACEVKVSNPGWCDYVFEADYNLMSLGSKEQFIKENKHLPGVPSEAEVEENGIELAKMNAVLLKQIEELTLHLIEMEKRINELEK